MLLNGLPVRDSFLKVLDSRALEICSSFNLAPWEELRLGTLLFWEPRKRFHSPVPYSWLFRPASALQLAHSSLRMDWALYLEAAPKSNFQKPPIEKSQKM